MLNHTKQIKEMYEEIQRKLLYMIPEKWEAIYLYSSIIENSKSASTGELFFYYIPKGIFRKNPVNVYEVPSKFNIDEKQYLELAQKLYEDIKELREEFKRTTPGEMWSNLTISITNMKFRAEYSYEDLVNNAFNRQVSKKDKEILFRYFNGARNLAEVEEYNAGIYIEQDTKNIIEYNTQEDEIENDGYIREDDIQTIGAERKYNQIQSHKIENNWDANARKKENTMWSHQYKASEQYMMKPSRNNKRNLSNSKNSSINFKESKEFKEETQQISKERVKPRRNQILFSEDEIDEE